MARWRQCSETGKFIPIDESAARRDFAQGKNLNIIRGNFEAFKSPVDGTIIDGHRAMENHNKRNDVVSASEYSPEYYAQKAKEREDFFNGKHSREELFKRKQEIYDTIIRAERDNG